MWLATDVTQSGEPPDRASKMAGGSRQYHLPIFEYKWFMGILWLMAANPELTGTSFSSSIGSSFVSVRKFSVEVLPFWNPERTGTSFSSSYGSVWCGGVSGAERHAIMELVTAGGW
ncbi:uncharacterized protein LOC134214347 [Armigeres subalbatus]|uniref:uncharacterized protein LOC134214347 n=1 Tax=Armigeres subalbatus TaxID=124917 RepID=UPI002ED4B36B